jgi:steroid delta-isomerase-like uncharacterized protein
MSGPDARSVVLRYLEAVNSGDIDAMAALQAPGFVHHSGAGDLDANGMKQGFIFYKSAFPDFRYELGELFPIDGGTAILARWTMRGTHTGGTFFGAVAKGRAFESPGMSLHRVADGLIVEEWEFNDDMGLMRQLGFRVEPPEGGPDGA